MLKEGFGFVEEVGKGLEGLSGGGKVGAAEGVFDLATGFLDRVGSNLSGVVLLDVDEAANLAGIGLEGSRGKGGDFLGK